MGQTVELGHGSSPALLLGIASSAIQFLGLQAQVGTHTISPLVLMLLHSDWNDTTGFPGSPVCKEQMMGLSASIII